MGRAVLHPTWEVIIFQNLSISSARVAFIILISLLYLSRGFPCDIWDKVDPNKLLVTDRRQGGKRDARTLYVGISVPDLGTSDPYSFRKTPHVLHTK